MPCRVLLWLSGRRPYCQATPAWLPNADWRTLGAYRPHPKGPKPRGLHVTDPLRQGLETARDRLKHHGHPDLASYVDTVLAPRGWIALRDSETLGPTTPLSITTTKYLKGVLK